MDGCGVCGELFQAVWKASSLGLQAAVVFPWDGWSVGVNDNLHRQLGPTYHSEFYWKLLRLRVGTDR